ncbi:OPT/YSL family transporter, partial [bacterium]|nr:OPT/YSL family transporter [bacterium]
LYLPVHLAVPIMMGGLVRLFVEKRFTGEDRSDRRETGVLFASGLIAGAALIGVVGAALTFFEVEVPGRLSDRDPADWFWAIAALFFLGGLLMRKVTARGK